MIFIIPDLNWKKMVDEIVGLFSSSACPICREEINTTLCSACKSKFEYLKPPLCRICGDPLNTSDKLCPDCREKPQRYEISRSIVLYKTEIKQIIHEIKFKGKTELLLHFETILWKYFKRNSYLFEADVLTSVPPNLNSPERKICLATGLAKILKEKAGLNYKLVLERKREIKLQHKLKGKNRWENAKDAFKLKDNMDINNKSILLIDDIFTTGATVYYCSKALKEAGADKIKVLTLARTPRKE
ncbi:MAG: ComF family protein [Vulcanimicrobiota bacterium]